MSAALIWILLGIFLIISELLATSVVAVFFGIAAVVVGILLQIGLISSAAMQFTIFGLISLASLLLARGKLKVWFKGYTADRTQGKPDFQHDIGARGTVVDDFVSGSGQIILNGVRWKAFSEEDLHAGETIWICSNDGIELTVSREKPAKLTDMH